MYSYETIRNAVPSGYSDPDISEAENLTIAAYHLIQAGRGDEALPFINSVLELFGDVPFDRKRRMPSKRLGKVDWLPCGILSLNVSGRVYDVPAAAYDPGKDEKEEAKAALKKASTACKDAGMHWFPSRQAVAAMQHGIPSAGTFRPASMLQKVFSICRNARPDIAEPASAVLAGKLTDILDKNPLRGECYTALRRDLYTVGNDGYCWDPDAECGFAWLDEEQVKSAMKLLEEYHDDIEDLLRGLPFHVVKWEETGRDAANRMLDVLQEPESDDLSRLPFLRSYQEAMKSRRSYYGTDECRLRGIMWSACQTACDVSNLQRCHAALCRQEDLYLKDMLVRCKMTDPELDKELPEDLWKQAAMCVMGKAWDMDLDKEKVRGAFDAMRCILDKPATKKSLESPLLRPKHESDRKEVPEDAPDVQP